MYLIANKILFKPIDIYQSKNKRGTLCDILRTDDNATDDLLTTFLPHCTQNGQNSIGLCYTECNRVKRLSSRYRGATEQGKIL